MRIMIAGLMLALLAACAAEPHHETATPEGVEADMANGALASPVPPKPPAPAEGVRIERKDGTLEFSYDWPGAAHDIAPLDAWLRAQAEARYRKAHDEAEEGRVAAGKGDYPFHTYSYQQSWQSVADTASLLVMQGEGYSFTGGAHGMPFTVSLIWDRGAQRRLATGDILDISRLAGVTRDAFCKELDRQREEKRGEPVNPDATGGIPEFNRCVDMTHQEILPVAREGKTLDAIRVVIGPYEAGPYAEGSYQIDLPMTPAMMDAVKPAYRGWFGTGTP